MKRWRESKAAWIALILNFGALNLEARIPKEQYLPPSLNNFYRQAEFLGFLAKELPDLIREGTEYDTDLFELLAHQHQAVEYLLEHSKYSKALKARGPLIEITALREVKSKQQNTFILNPQAIRIAEQSQTLAKHTKALRNAIASYSSDFGELNVPGAITGLVSLLPAEARGAVLRRPVLGQLLALSSETKVLSKSFSSGFRYQDVGLSKLTLTKTLDLLNEAQKLRESTKSNLLQILTFQGSGSIKERLENAFITSKEFPASLSEFATNPWVQQIWSELKREMVVKVSGDALSKTQTLLTLREVPGYLATLRGFVGVDCASQFSFPYGLLPSEHTFFIYDSEGLNLGYVMLTELEWNSKPAVYLHDISGPRITPELVDITLSALQQTFAQLGFRNLVLPTVKNGHRNINFKHVRKAINQWAADGTKGPLSYPDAEIRALVGKMNMVTVDSSYDAPEQNTEARAIGKVEIPGIKIQHQQASWPSTDQHKISKKEAALLALEIDFPTWSSWALAKLQSALRLTEAPGQIQLDQRRNAAELLVDKREVAESHKILDASEVLQNEDGLTGKKYLAAVAEYFEDTNVRLDDILNGHRHLLYEGILNSSDVFESKSQEANDLAWQAVRAAVLRRNQPEVVKKLLEKNLSKISSSPEFDEFVQDLIRDKESHLKMLAWLLKRKMEPMVIAPYLSRLEEIAKNSTQEGTQKAAETVLKLVGKMDLGSCRELLEE